MRRTSAVLAAASLAAAVGITGAATPALAATHATTTHTTTTHATTTASYYLSLGDSLAQGVQPNAAGTDVETSQGYADQLYTALKATNPALKLDKLGCPGETTTSMINGGLCTYPDTSQLAQAVAFLKAHLGHVQLVTIDIGANDLNPCIALTVPSQIVTCLEKVIPVAVQNLTTIMTQLRAAAGATTKIIGMSYYDPEAADWLQGTSAGRQLAALSRALLSTYNGDLGKVYTAAGATVADVYTAFHTGGSKPYVTLPAFGSVPRYVAYVCSYTWACAAPPVGPNEHANRLGYAVIANTFLNADLG